MKKTGLIYFIILLLVSTVLLYGCDTGGDSGGGGGSASGGKVMDFSGGNGTSGAGGDGGFVYMGSYSDIEIKSSGIAEAGFNLPSGTNIPSYMTCADEFKPNTTMSVNTFSDGAPLGAAGDYYMLFGSSNLKRDFNMDGIASTSDMTVDCVNIPQGVTVTLGLNFDVNNADADGQDSTGADLASINLTGDLRVAGALKAALLISSVGNDATNGSDSGSLQIYANDVFVPGTISTAGLDNTGGRGGHGGWIDLEAFQGVGGTLMIVGTLDCSGGDGGTASDGGIGCALTDGSGSFSSATLYTWADQYNINKGKILANGGNGGGNGGDAGFVQLEADSHLYNTGSILAMGGNGDNTAAGSTGGSGQGISFFSYLGSVNISGTVDGKGGTGADGGGDGADIDISSGVAGISSVPYAAPTNVPGSITVYGGDALSNGDGGHGGYIYIYSYGGDIKVSGNLNGSGGNAAGTSNSGGDGDFIEFGVESSVENAWGNSLPTGGITVSGNLNVSGGDGDFGGNGGFIQASHFDTPEYVLPEAFPIRFLGYSRVDGHGGTATGNGANGGSADNVYLETLIPLSNGAYLLAGHVENNARIDLSGGDGDTTSGSAGTGGSGGSVDMYSNGAIINSVYDASNKVNYVLNTGRLELSSGMGDIGGSTSGSYVQMYGYNEVKNSAIVNLNAGNGTTNGGASDSWISFLSSQDVINSGKITANGGNGSDGNGGGATIAFLSMSAGGQTRNSGALLAKGGNGNVTTGIGGGGGAIDLRSQQKATSNTASLSVVGGTGNTKGVNGTILIDGGDITPTDGTL